MIRRSRQKEGETVLFEAPGWWAAARTEKGLVRPDNEDTWRVLLDGAGPRGPVHGFAVFDGVGGMPSGGAAARAAAEALPKAVKEAGAHGSVLARLNTAVLPTGGATTAVVALFPADGRPGLLLSVGDSGAYRLDAKGQVDPVAVRDSAGWNRLLDFLGNPGLSGHAVPVRLEVGQSLLLCTDGVDAVTGPGPLEGVLAAAPEDAVDRLEALFRLVQAKGAPDNATVVLLRRTA